MAPPTITKARVEPDWNVDGETPVWGLHMATGADGRFDGEKMDMSRLEKSASYKRKVQVAVKRGDVIGALDGHSFRMEEQRGNTMRRQGLQLEEITQVTLSDGIRDAGVTLDAFCIACERDCHFSQDAGPIRWQCPDVTHLYTPGNLEMVLEIGRDPGSRLEAEKLRALLRGWCASPKGFSLIESMMEKPNLIDKSAGTGMESQVYQAALLSSAVTFEGSDSFGEVMESTWERLLSRCQNDAYREILSLTSRWWCLLKAGMAMSDDCDLYPEATVSTLADNFSLLDKKLRSK